MASRSLTKGHCWAPSLPPILPLPLGLVSLESSAMVSSTRTTAWSAIWLLPSMLRGADRVGCAFPFAAAACNVIRLTKLIELDA